MLPPGYFELDCPSCQARLVVDGRGHKVSSHRPAGVKAVTDIGLAARSLQEDARRREEIFRQSVSEEKSKSGRLEKSFDDALRKAQQDPTAPPPPREIDLD
jgi:hypothetical protein